MLTGYICLCISCTEITQQKGGTCYTCYTCIPIKLYRPMTAKLKYLLQKYFFCNVFKRLTLRCVGTHLTPVRYPKRNILPGTLGFITTSLYLSFAVHIEFCMNYLWGVSYSCSAFTISAFLGTKSERTVNSDIETVLLLSTSLLGMSTSVFLFSFRYL